MTLKLAVAPSPAISWEDAKVHLRIEDDVEQAYVEGLIAGVTHWLDAYTGILGWAIMEQQWDLTYDAFPSAAVELPLGPVVGVASVNYVDRDTGLEVAIADDQYAVDKGGQFSGWVIPASTWPTPMATANAVRVRFTVGHAECPPAIRAAILLVVSLLYSQRGEVTDEMPPAVKMLLSPFRKMLI